MSRPTAPGTAVPAPGPTGSARGPVRIDRSPMPRRFQAFWVGLAMLAFFPGLYAVIMRVLAPNEDLLALTASFIPYGILFSLVSVLGFLVALIRARRRRALAVTTTIAALMLALQLGWQAPFFVADHRPLSTRTITVLSLNLRSGGADLDALSREASGADVLVLVEVTPWAMQGLRSGALAARFPYAVPDGQQASTRNGSAILSRFPLSQARALPPTSWQMWSAVADVPGMGDLTVVGAHPCNPFCGTNRWSDEHRVLDDYLDTLGTDRRVLVAGDFNAVDDHAPMLALKHAGYRSATDLAGAGWLPTYPANSVVPPLIPIDHILLDDRLTATRVTAFTVPGTDHRGLRAVIGGTR
ncbi:endonuclease/exonuclease/phosphatase (EEP) superfamily protein YafD [Friedmanniella endophytica]|uniref:Endonuclease/exonuclease/phosphatase (EEP) superfamily protein YafD n=1 Tax=Microlunatus kandeliicorticis TaxID=1759536 RepID=A0A7W3IVH0_9ACTN|nr:endonuclease/exonuclease/phosphatase family protein [Microlunatus kandeliicorticis]MBA8795865.1 endonuclease/exonuclease/phosphatase (EEP) superfamily protein YafD [Microlunatus kandeliicorticis]